MHESKLVGLLTYLNALLLLQVFGSADNNLGMYVANGKFTVVLIQLTANCSRPASHDAMCSLCGFLCAEKSLGSRLRLLVAIFGYRSQAKMAMTATRSLKSARLAMKNRFARFATRVFVFTQFYELVLVL